MNDNTRQGIHRVTALTTFAALALCLFFQLSKGGRFRDVNPFGDDPYDAVGSFAIQGALLIGLLTYARALRLREDPGQSARARLILRGNIFVLSAILITLIADAVAEISFPSPPSYWGNVLLVELATMLLLALICVTALTIVFRRVRTVPPPRELTLADGIDDLWTLVRVPITKFGAVLPRAFVEWAERFNGDRFFARAPWLDPRKHWWRFAFVLGLAVGVGLALAQLQEGPPPSVRIGLLVAGIFAFGELAATLVGFALFGGYLGLRPPFTRNVSS
jgi:hypothetical protein